MSVATIPPERIERFKADLAQRGQSQMDFARQRGLNYNVMQMVLQGRLKCVRGEAFKAAKAMGLKEAA